MICATEILIPNYTPSQMVIQPVWQTAKKALQLSWNAVPVLLSFRWCQVVQSCATIHLAAKNLSYHLPFNSLQIVHFHPQIQAHLAYKIEKWSWILDHGLIQDPSDFTVGIIQAFRLWNGIHSHFICKRLQKICKLTV